MFCQDHFSNSFFICETENFLKCMKQLKKKIPLFVKQVKKIFWHAKVIITEIIT